MSDAARLAGGPRAHILECWHEQATHLVPALCPVVGRDGRSDRIFVGDALVQQGASRGAIRQGERARVRVERCGRPGACCASGCIRC